MCSQVPIRVLLVQTYLLHRYMDGTSSILLYVINTTQPTNLAVYYYCVIYNLFVYSAFLCLLNMQTNTL